MATLTFYLWQKAADMSFGPAHYQLGYIYLEGRLVPRDLVEAYKWLSFAKLFSNQTGQPMYDDTVKVLDILQGRLSTQQLKEAEKRMNNWWNRPRGGNSKAAP